LIVATDVGGGDTGIEGAVGVAVGTELQANVRILIKTSVNIKQTVRRFLTLAMSLSSFLAFISVL
jgi:hypothetical protein